MDRLTRRELLRRGGQVAAGVAFASQLEWLTGCGTSGKAPTESDWNDLAHRLQGRLVRPGETGYARLHTPSNLLYADVHPAGIVLCGSPEDVRQSILWTRDHDLPAVPRAGGHSYSGYSVTPGLLVDLRRMNAVKVSRTDGTATIEPGALNTDIYDGLQPYGVAFSAGRCPTVAVSGLTLGGGFGFSSRKLGLSADALLETQVATADGQILACSEKENPDLFWACRGGGGGNFGINTTFTFRTYPVDHVTLYDLSWDWSEAAKVISTLQEVVTEAPDEWSLRIGIGTSGLPGKTRPTIGALGQFFGPKRDLLAILDPVLSAAKPRKSLIARRTFWQAKTYLYDTTPVGRYAVKSNYVAGPFPAEGIDVLLRAVERWPGSSNSDGGGIALFAWGGAIGQVAPDETAFVHRKARFLMAYDTAWGANDDPALVRGNLGWLDRLAADIRPYVTRQAYQNFIDRSLSNWEDAYYGENLARLVRVKKQVDPDNFFHFKQSIPTSVVGTA
jgi:FAD/FMN-containing dehydrogenase